MRTYAASRWTVLWKLRVPASLPYVFSALQDRSDGERRRRDHRRAAVRAPVGPRRRDPQLQPVLLDRAAGALGDEHHRGARSGSSSSSLVVGAEKLVVRRAPEVTDVSARDEPVVAIERRHEDVPARQRHRAAGHRPRARAGRVRLADRAVGLRQVDAAARDRRPDRADRRAPSRSTASRRGRRAPTTTTGSSSRTPCSSTGARSRRTSRCRSRCSAGTATRRKARVEEMLELVELQRLRRPPPVAALGRHAAARLDRPRARFRAGAAADGRAVRRARRDDARAAEPRAALDLAAARARPSSSSRTRSPRRCSSRRASS